MILNQSGYVFIFESKIFCLCNRPPSTKVNGRHAHHFPVVIWDEPPNRAYQAFANSLCMCTATLPGLLYLPPSKSGGLAFFVHVRECQEQFRSPQALPLNWSVSHSFMHFHPHRLRVKSYSSRSGQDQWPSDVMSSMVVPSRAGEACSCLN
jgi:hypothetical protein